MKHSASQTATLALILAASQPLAGALTLSSDASGESAQRAPEDFAVVASEALTNLSSQFKQFRSTIAAHTSQLAVALRDQDAGIHAIEAANTRITVELDALRESNAGLRKRAKALITGNNHLRTELLSLQQKLRVAATFAASAIEGSNASENAEVVAAETPSRTGAPAHAQQAEMGSAIKAVGTEGRNTKVQDRVSEGTGMSEGASGADGTEALGAPHGEATALGQPESDGGYVEAFTGGDGEETADAEEAADEGYGGLGSASSLLAVSAKRTQTSTAGRLRLQKAVPADALASTADGFADLQKSSVAVVQQFFESALLRLKKRHAKVLATQSSLNVTRAALESLHSRLLSSIDHFKSTNGHLRLRVQSLGGFLQRLVNVTRAADENVENVLHVLPAAP